MSLFAYEARTADEGFRQVGTVEASTREAAIETLQRHNLIITKLEDIGARSLLEREFAIPFFGGISKKDVVMFSRQLAVLFGARVPLIESLQTLANQTVKRKMRALIDGISADVEGGASLSLAFGAHPDVFSSLYVNVVHSGEVSGKLQEVLEYIAKNLEREYVLFRKIRGALVYPALVTMVMAGVLAVMIIFIIPNLRAIFEESGADLPLVTRFFLGFADFMRRIWWLLAMGFGLSVTVFLRFIRTKRGKERWDAWLLNVPVFGALAKDLYVARMADNLGTLITSGLPITQALEITGDVVGNARFRDILAEAGQAVRRGETIHGILRLHPDVVPMLVSQMVAVGEKSGQLDSMLGHVARFYQGEVDDAVDNLVNLIEPFLIIVLGLGVAFLVAAILLPIYNLAGAL